MDYFGFIYITTNIITGHRYLGKCKSSKPNSKYYLGSGKLLKPDIKKYSAKAFTREIIDYAYDNKELLQKEFYYIKQYNCIDSDNWYNVSWHNTCGFAGKKHSAETKEKMRQNHKRPVYDSTREAFREAGKKNKSYLKAAAKRKELTGDKHHRSMPVVVDGIRYESISQATKQTNLSYNRLRLMAISQCELQ